MFVIWLGIALLGCSSSEGGLTPESAGALAARIAADPAGAEAALTEAGTTPEAFEAYLYEVAADAELTRRYLAARGG